MKCILLAICTSFPYALKAQGLFYKLPPDGSWVVYDVNWTYKAQGAEQSGSWKIKLASMGQTIENSQKCRWIEFYNITGEGTYQIRKLLIPEKYLKPGENPTLHVIRGWTKNHDDEIAPAVPMHGRWPAYLAGPLNDEKKLPKELVESKLGSLECKGLSGWIKFTETDKKTIAEIGLLTTKVTIDMRLNSKALFGVVSSRLFFECNEGSPSYYTIDAIAIISDFGTGAESKLPDSK